MLQVIESKEIVLKEKISAVLPKHVDPERVFQIARNEIINNPQLNECSPQSFLNAVVRCASLGLEPGLSQEAYLIPYGGKAGDKTLQLIIGYRGLIRLARNAGTKSVCSRAVYEKDTYHYEYGLDEKLVHIPAKGDRGEFVAAYCVAVLRDDSRIFEWMDLPDILRIRDRSKSSKHGPWTTDFVAMACKTATRKLLSSGAVPTSVECMEACSIDSQYEAGKQKNIIDIDLDVEPERVKAPAEKILEKLES